MLCRKAMKAFSDESLWARWIKIIKKTGNVAEEVNPVVFADFSPIVETQWWFLDLYVSVQNIIIIIAYMCQSGYTLWASLQWWQDLAHESKSGITYKTKTGIPYIEFLSKLGQEFTIGP